MLDTELSTDGPARIMDKWVYLSYENIPLMLNKQNPWRLLHWYIGSPSIFSIFGTDFLISVGITIRFCTNGHKNNWIHIHLGNVITPATILSYSEQYFMDNIVVWYNCSKPSGAVIHGICSENRMSEGMQDIDYKS